MAGYETARKVERERDGEREIRRGEGGRGVGREVYGGFSPHSPRSALGP